MAEYTVKRGIERMEGVEILRWRIELPRWEGLEEISGFYGELEEKTVSFCQGELKKRAKEAYAACEDPKKRFHFSPMVYRLTGKETARERNLLSVSLEITLQAGDELLGREILGQIFSESEQLLLSPEQAARAWDGRRLRAAERRQTGGVLLRDGGLFFKEDFRWILSNPTPKKVKKLAKTS